MRFLVVFIALLASAGEAAAQSYAAQRPAAGVWFTGGIGTAWASLDCGECTAAAEPVPYGGGIGIGAHAAIGWVATRRLQPGGGFSLYGRRIGERDATLWMLGPVLRVHPARASSAFVTASAGFSGTTFAGEGLLVESGGVAAELGAGFEHSVFGLTITPQAGLLAGSYGAAPGRPDIALDAARRPVVVRATVGITWY